MNAAIEMHDSELLAIEQGGPGLSSVILKAYVHRTEGQPGVTPGEGGVQRVRIRVKEISIEGEVGELPAYILEGSVKSEQTIQDNIVPFPAAHSGPVRISMMLAPDARVVVVVGSEVSIDAEGEFRFVEHFS